MDGGGDPTGRGGRPLTDSSAIAIAIAIVGRDRARPRAPGGEAYGDLLTRGGFLDDADAIGQEQK